MFGIPDVFGLKGMLIGCAVSVLLGGAGGAYLGYRFEHGNYVELQLADAQAEKRAIQAALDKQAKINAANQQDAVDAAYFRGRMDATVVKLVSGAPANVTIKQDQDAANADSAGCITYGFARLLYAGAHGVDAESVQLPSGESVDTCTALKPSELAAAVAQDLAAGYSNGHQLDALIAATKRNDAIATGE